MSTPKRCFVTLPLCQWRAASSTGGFRSLDAGVPGRRGSCRAGPHKPRWAGPRPRHCSGHRAGRGERHAELPLLNTLAQSPPGPSQLPRGTARRSSSPWRQRSPMAPAAAGGSGRSGGGRVWKGGAGCHVSAGRERRGRQGLSWQRPPLRPVPPRCPRLGHGSGAEQGGRSAAAVGAAPGKPLAHGLHHDEEEEVQVPRGAGTGRAFLRAFRERHPLLQGAAAGRGQLQRGVLPVGASGTRQPGLPGCPPHVGSAGGPRPPPSDGLRSSPRPPRAGEARPPPQPVPWLPRRARGSASSRRRAGARGKEVRLPWGSWRLRPCCPPLPSPKGKLLWHRAGWPSSRPACFASIKGGRTHVVAGTPRLRGCSLPGVVRCKINIEAPKHGVTEERNQSDEGCARETGLLCHNAGAAERMGNRRRGFLVPKPAVCESRDLIV